MSQQLLATGSSEEQGWNFTVPPMNLRGAKMQLLTIGKVSVNGTWQGALGQYFVAWAPLLKIPKDAVFPTIIYNGPRHG